MTKPKDDISVEELRELLDLDPATGALTWKARPAHLFATGREHGRWNTRFAGKSAFQHTDRRGYFRGSIRNQHYMAHRVVWALHHGEWPAGQLDHINGVKTDNRPENLRATDGAGNQRNRALTRRNTSGVVGVTPYRDGKRWKAEMRLADKTIYLGLFDTIEEAAAARKAAEIEHGFHPNHGRPREDGGTTGGADG